METNVCVEKERVRAAQRRRHVVVLMESMLQKWTLDDIHLTDASIQSDSKVIDYIKRAALLPVPHLEQ